MTWLKSNTKEIRRESSNEYLNSGIEKIRLVKEQEEKDAFERHKKIEQMEQQDLLEAQFL